MKTLDPRIRRTRKRLGDSLLALSLEKGYKKFTIRELTKHADVGYATFYRHFKHLDALLTHIFRSAYQDLTERLTQQENLFDQAVTLYGFVSQHPDVYRVYFDLSPSHPVRAVFVEESKKLMIRLWDEKASSHPPLALPVDCLLECSDMLIHWYLDRLDEYTAEQIATMHFDLIIKGTHSLLPPTYGSLAEPATHKLID